LEKLIVPTKETVEYVVFTCPLAAHIARVVVGELYIPKINSQHTVQVMKKCVYIPDKGGMNVKSVRSESNV